MILIIEKNGCGVDQSEPYMKARFDEARNVDFAQRLESAGCNLAYG